MNKLLNRFENWYKRFKFEIHYSILVIVTTFVTISILEALQ